MKTVILAEKPSQAKAYAETFQQQKRHEGYYEISDPLFAGEVTITYGFGHLVDMVAPGAYEERWAKWSLENLPIFPETFRYEVPMDKRAQFSIVKRELQSADTIIIATDGDREGEAIAWSIIRQANAFSKEKNYLRLWINSLEKEAIYEGFKNLQPGKNYFPKYKEAQARQNADWLIGMNGSPLYSLLLQRKGIDGSFSLGRVQTPTLYMIYQLQEEIKHFKKETYFEGEGLITTNKGQFSGKIVPKKAFKTQEELTKEIEKLGAHLGKQNGRILEVTKKEKRLHSPRLFSLSSLQTKMNQLMKASAKATLDAAQGLYESKFLSYPRTDSFYITENEHQYLVKHLQNYKKFLGIEEVQTTEIKAKKRYVDAKKVQEHHAIIPTKTIPTPARFAKLSKLQQAIYLQVLRTTVAMFAADYIYEETTVMTGVQQLKLKSIGKIPLQQGWQEILRIKSKKKEAQTLPLTSAEMTARWEGYLRKIGKQEGTPSVFLENIKKFILHLLAEVPNQIDKVDFSDEISGIRQIKAMEKKNDQLGRCPKCKKGIVMLYPKIATCLNPECDFKLWPTVAKKKLTKTNLRDLLSKGKTSKVVKGFTGKKGKFDAVLVLKEDMTIGFSFPWIENSGTKAVDGNKETSRKNNENEVE
ncbi:DNA topoisomerase [Enterococcus faecium]|nr:DNA topoisomerase [Enterococcus faecium]MDT6896654.1 DNA topoisomerase [Enterococcus faecium]MDV4526245.1 DNA topoisomerase [Enterococcus faecium]MDV4539749.1 DNA topoisomerase [Enterococcus faecium]MDV4732526.1 DNA topoisomerase [Enterococcus faecium]